MVQSHSGMLYEVGTTLKKGIIFNILLFNYVWSNIILIIIIDFIKAIFGQVVLAYVVINSNSPDVLIRSGNELIYIL